MIQSSALGHSGETTLIFRGEQLSLLLSPDVAAPNYYTDLIIEFLAGYDRTGMSVADLGCGTGILSIIASRFLNASSVWAIDINPSAVDLTRKNCARNACSLETITIENTDIWSARPRRALDLLVANPPQIPSSDDSDRTCSGGPTGRATMARIFELASNALSKDAMLIMTAAAFVGISALTAAAVSFGLRIEMLASKLCNPV